MESNTGYIITKQNSHLVANLTGQELKTIENNIGWAVVYTEEPNPRWQLMPRNIAFMRRGFAVVDSPMNGLPARTEKEIRQEWAEVNNAYAKKIEELEKELERRKLIDSDTKE